MSQMSVGLKLAIGGAVLASVLAYVAYLGASSSWQYYLTVDECAANAEQFVGRRVRVSGRVEPGSLVIRDDRSAATFLLTGTRGRLQATCPAPLPDNLDEDMDVVVEGRLEKVTHLQGDKVLTRCASKYQSQ
jgi:cytochrome c-type biogenesis protein CcmE